MNQIGQTNEFLQHGFLDGDELKQVFWRHRTLQEFFAALWLTKFAPPEDSHWMGAYLYHLFMPRAQQRAEHAEFHWPWRFAAEMPLEQCSKTCWSCTMKPLFQPGDGNAKRVRRSSEMIYRSYKNVEDHAADSAVSYESAKEWKTIFQQECLAPYRSEAKEILRCEC